MPRQFGPGKYETQAKNSTDPAELAGLAQRPSSYVRSAVASNPHTSPEVLTLLAQTGDKYVRSRVAGNPSTPTETLLTLVEEDEYTQAALASNPRLPVETLRQLATAASVKVRKRVAESPRSDSVLLTVLANDSTPEVRAAVAAHDAAPDEVLVELASDPSAEVAWGLAKRHAEKVTQFRTVTARRAPAGRYAQPSSQEIRIPVEPGGRFSAALLTAFAQSPHGHLHRVAAAQPDAPTEALMLLAESEDVWVRVRVAENPGAPDAVLLKVAERGGPEVMQALAVRPDHSAAVLAAVAMSRVSRAHERLPSESGHVLLRDPDPKVRAAAANVFASKEWDAWQKMLADADRQVRTAAAAAMSATLFSEVVRHECAHVRRIVADRTSFADHLRVLGEDSDAVVRRRVAKNVSTPADVLSLLASDPDARVRTYVAERFLDALNS